MAAHTPQPGAQTYVPDTADLEELATAVQDCRGCELYRAATQGVMGEGPMRPRLMLVGEQPGDREDLAGAPFVGPAGRLLDDVLERAGLDRDDVFVTNAVKHFRWAAAPDGGARRLHKKPTSAQVRACQPWLRAEVRAVVPSVIVLLGATAAMSVLGSGARVGELRGRKLDTPQSWRDVMPHRPPLVVTIHPAAALRARDRDALTAQLLQDLTFAAGLAATRRPSIKTGT